MFQCLCSLLKATLGAVIGYSYCLMPSAPRWAVFLVSTRPIAFGVKLQSFGGAAKGNPGTLGCCKKLYNPAFLRFLSSGHLRSLPVLEKRLYINQLFGGGSDFLESSLWSDRTLCSSSSRLTCRFTLQPDNPFTQMRRGY